MVSGKVDLIMEEDYKEEEEYKEWKRMKDRSKA